MGSGSASSITSARYHQGEITPAPGRRNTSTAHVQRLGATASATDVLLTVPAMRLWEHLEDTELPTVTPWSLASCPQMQGGAGWEVKWLKTTARNCRGGVRSCNHGGLGRISRGNTAHSAAAKPRSNMPVTLLTTEVRLSPPENHSWWRSHFVLWQYI